MNINESKFLRILNYFQIEITHKHSTNIQFIFLIMYKKLFSRELKHLYIVFEGNYKKCIKCRKTTRYF